MSPIQFTASGYAFTVTGTLVTKACPMCGVPYALPEEFDEWNQKKPHRNFYCPNGHQLHYPGPTEAEKLRQRLEDERRRSKATRDLLAAEERSHAATKGHLTRQKRRAAAGVCPCCNRTFKQLARHMEGQHPEYVASVRVSVPAKEGDVGRSVGDPDA